jgi:hypothetical protein
MTARITSAARANTHRQRIIRLPPLLPISDKLMPVGQPAERIVPRAASREGTQIFSSTSVRAAPVFLSRIKKVAAPGSPLLLPVFGFRSSGF